MKSNVVRASMVVVGTALIAAVLLTGAPRQERPAEPTATARPAARHLPQKAGPAKKGFDMVSFPYTASGAGTSAANGEYVESGVDVSGNPYGYNGTYYVRWFNVGAGLWVVASNMTSEPAFLYEAEGPVTAFPLTGWTVNGGAEPAPTFAGVNPSAGVLMFFLLDH